MKKIRRIPADMSLELHSRDLIKLKHIDSIAQFLVLEKDARVDFRKLKMLKTSWQSPSFLNSSKALTDEQQQDSELFMGIEAVRDSFKEDVIDDINLPVDVVFSYHEDSEMLGLLPIYHEDRVKA